MMIIGADHHPGFQQIAYVDTETGELQERRLEHPEEAEKFYRELATQGKKVRVGMEASGHARWFERLLAELNFELWIGDAAEIRTKRVRKQKTDRQDAQRILKLMLEDRFPRIWVPSWENRDLRQLLWHRHRMVQARTRIMNQLQAVALNEGLGAKKRLWREAGREQLAALRLAPWARRRRQELLELLDQLNPIIGELTKAVEEEAEKCPEAQRTDDASRGRSAEGTCLRAGDRNGRAVWLRQADCELPRAGAGGRFQRGTSTARTYLETRQLSAAFPVGGSRASHGAQQPGMGQ
jgi:transposase